MELVVFVGLQGAGKSTFYRDSFAATHKHVSKDNFRNNKNKARRQTQLITEAFHNGQSVVVDNTNLSAASRAELIELARQFGARILCYYFLPDLTGSLERNATRTGHERVPEVALYVANAKLEPPSLAEGFDELWTVQLDESGRKLQRVENHEVGCFDSRMRTGEYFHNLHLWPGAWTVVRCDGRSFSRFTETNFDKPFDARFHAHMLETAQALFEDLGAIYTFTESDEISVLLPPSWDGFSREWEKLVTVSAGIASAAFTHSSGHRVHFDARIWMGATIEAVEDYFRWRQSDGERCGLNGWCYWTLRQQGKSARQATRVLDGATKQEKLELLRASGTEFIEVPNWQRTGTGFLWETYEKEGYNPKLGTTVTATRRRVAVRELLPTGDEYAKFIRNICTQSAT